MTNNDMRIPPAEEFYPTYRIMLERLAEADIEEEGLSYNEIIQIKRLQDESYRQHAPVMLAILAQSIYTEDMSAGLEFGRDMSVLLEAEEMALDLGILNVDFPEFYIFTGEDDEGKSELMQTKTPALVVIRDMLLATFVKIDNVPFTSNTTFETVFKLTIALHDAIIENREIDLDDL